MEQYANKSSGKIPLVIAIFQEHINTAGGHVQLAR